MKYFSYIFILLNTFVYFDLQLQAAQLRRYCGIVVDSRGKLNDNITDDEDFRDILNLDKEDESDDEGDFINPLLLKKPDQSLFLDDWFQAAKSGNLEEIKKLLFFVDVNILDQDGVTALIWAIAYGHQEVIDFLLQEPEIDLAIQDKDGDTALIRALSRGTEEMAEQLLKFRNVNINAQDHTGDTALFLACYHRYENIVKILLEIPGIKLNIKNDSELTAYQIAQKRHGGEVIAQMIKDKIDQLSSKAFETLHIFAKSTTEIERQNNLEIVKSIVEQLGPEITDQAGNRLLDRAFVLNCPDVILFLLQNTKDVHKLLCTQNQNGKFAFELISPTSALFQYFIDLAYGTSAVKPVIQEPKSTVCAVCAEPSITRCSNCREVYYCSLYCQKADWKVHKTQCGKHILEI